jgi:uncharacterized membrane protein
MIRLVLYAIAIVALIYFLLWIKGKWSRLHPNTKKQILFLGMNGLFNFLRLKWQIILVAIWQIVKRLRR